MSNSFGRVPSTCALAKLCISMVPLIVIGGCADPPPLRTLGDSYGHDSGTGSGSHGTPGTDGGVGSDANAHAAPDTPAGSPSFGPATSLLPAPAPIVGGTLIVTRDDTHVIAADPDRDRVYVVDLASRKIVADVPLHPGDRPGRLVEDGAHRVHIALRGSGDVVTFDVATASVVARSHVCAAPRGIAWERALDRIHVSCEEGVVVTLAAGGGDPIRIVQLEGDLRDVVVVGDGLAISRFRSAEVLFLDAKGALVDRRSPLPWTGRNGNYSPQVAWRMIARPGSPEVVVLHQRERTSEIVEGPKYYGDGEWCGGSVVSTTLAILQNGVAPTQTTAPIPSAVVPVDVAASLDGAHYAVVAAGNAHLVHGAKLGDVAAYPLIVVKVASVSPDGCASVEPWPNQPIGEPTSVAFDGSGDAVVFTREPASIQILGRLEGVRFDLRPAEPSVRDAGHEVFHASSGGRIACASCHPEGGDDGHVWNLGGSLLRTQPLAGTLASTAPYHWEGSMPTLEGLIGKTWVERMNGLPLGDERIDATKSWLLGLTPRPLAPPDPLKIAGVFRGKAIFEDPAVGCTSCHAGTLFTDSRTLDVGTGGVFQVPSLLRVGDRAPFLHGGCASTLRDVLTGCGVVDKHGKTSTLDEGQLGDLIAYLHTL